MWSPESPQLIDAEITLHAADGLVLDHVLSYTALRTVSVDDDRFLLNSRPYYLRMVLDQGYWPESLMVASAEQLRQDVVLIKRLGFNGVRKHQKLEDPRYYYWADRLGLLVWTEMPSAYRFTLRSVDRLTREWKDALFRDMSQPCVVTWVPFNESWGVPDLPSNPAQRDYVQALYHLTRTIDPSRPVVGNDGWESAATDMIGIHDYDDDPEKLRERYDEEEDIPQLFHKVLPAGRLLTLAGHPHAGQPLILSEFGGVAFTPPSEDARTWGYARAATADEFAARYAALLEVARTSTLLAGFCYTQFADTYQEANGLLYPDRRPKIPLETIRKATAGPREARDLELDEPRVMAEV
jgi:beta-galactosidase/beta-glucuronidase